MSINVIVADDSATIQKVVSITLANESASLSQCDSYEGLITMVQEKKYRAVLLDFGLSEDKSGYDVISEIKSIDANIKILTMLPAFESVDEGKLTEVGSFDTITKPFESAKFLSSFREMISSIDYDSSDSEGDDFGSLGSLGSNDISDDLFGDANDLSIGDSIGDIDEPEDNSGDDFNPDSWISRSPSIVDEGEKSKEELGTDFLEGDDDLNMDNNSNNETLNELSASMSDWGIEIPTPIESQNSSGPVFPPIIDGEDNSIEEDEDLNILKSRDNSGEELNLDGEEDPFMQMDVEDDSSEWEMNSSADVPIQDEPTREIVLGDDFNLSDSDDSNDEEAPIPDESTREILFDSSEFDNDLDTPSIDEQLSFGDKPVESTEVNEEDNEEVILPDDNDLEYPDLGGDLELGSESSDDLDQIQFDNPSDVSAKDRRPQFVDFENLQLDSKGSITNEHSLSKVRETRELEKEIESDIDPEDFWDEDAGLASSDAGSASSHASASSNAASASSETPSQNQQQPNLNNVDVEKFFHDIKVELLERVDRVVREICEEKIEKVAWEVLPEIAENLIKKEIKSIEQSEESR